MTPINRRNVLSLGLLPLVSAVAAAQQPPRTTTVADGRFSSGTPGERLPAGWVHVKLNDKKKSTRYSLVQDEGRVVLHALAQGAASVVARRAGIAVERTPVVRWRWKLGSVPDGADNSVASKEDSAARLVFAFEGDVAKLPLSDRSVMKLARSMSGREMPYATLMYVTSARAPVGQRIANPHTRRVQMIVAAREQDALGRWLDLERNLLDDYRAAFDEPPGRLAAFGVLTDSDNTGADVEAWYGDIAIGAGR